MKKIITLISLISMITSCNDTQDAIIVQDVILKKGKHSYANELNIIRNTQDSSYIKIAFYPNGEIEHIT